MPNPVDRRFPSRLASVIAVAAFAAAVPACPADIAAQTPPATAQPPRVEPGQRPPGPPAPAARTVPAPAGNAAHGPYLAEHVAMCVVCHSGRDEKGSIVEDQKFMGAPIPIKGPAGAQWATRAPRNRGLPGYTVQDGIRLLTQGAIARDGRQLRLPMPRFRMTPQDAADVVAYLKSLDTEDAKRQR
jgi:cytochrome c1